MLLAGLQNRDHIASYTVKLSRILAAYGGKDANIVYVERSIVLDCSNKRPFLSCGHASVVKYDHISGLCCSNLLDVCYEGVTCASRLDYKFERRVVQWPYDSAICMLLL